MKARDRKRMEELFQTVPDSPELQKLRESYGLKKMLSRREMKILESLAQGRDVKVA